MNKDLGLNELFTKKTKKMAKKIILTTSIFLWLCLVCSVTFSQVKEKPIKKIYLQVASGPSNHNGAFYEAGIQVVLKNNWVTTFSYHGIEMNPKNLPSDYEQGYVYLIFPFYDEFPVTKMDLFSFTAGKLFEAGRKIWFTTEAGFSLVNGETMSFSKQPIVWDGLYKSSNYSVSKENKTTIGGMLKADFNWAILRFLGLGAGVFVNLNSLQSPVGFQVKLMVGKLNLKRKQKMAK